MKLQKKLGGVVLAGGLSSRMGSDKALLCGGDGVSLLDKNIMLLQEFCEHTWVSCRKDSPITFLTSHPCVFDGAVQSESVGPVGGIYASLQRAHELKLDGIIVLACDMPYVTAQMLQKLITARNVARENADIKVTAYYEDEKNIFQGLCAIWEVDMELNEKIMGNYEERRLWKLYPEDMQHRVLYNENEMPQAFVNLNTPADLDTYLKR